MKLYESIQAEYGNVFKQVSGFIFMFRGYNLFISHVILDEFHKSEW